MMALWGRPAFSRKLSSRATLLLLALHAAAENSCPGACSGHGVCFRGRCICEESFISTDCSMRKLPRSCSPFLLRPDRLARAIRRALPTRLLRQWRVYGGRCVRVPGWIPAGRLLCACVCLRLRRPARGGRVRRTDRKLQLQRRVAWRCVRAPLVPQLMLGPWCVQRDHSAVQVPVGLAGAPRNAHPSKHGQR